MAERFAYLSQDEPGPETLAVLGAVPKRWGRMDRISRLAVVEVGRALRAAGLLRADSEKAATASSGGLIGAGRYGCLATDLAFAATMAGGLHLASPTLFSYTLPNIALAEAASHYGLTGPVYALFSGDQAEAEAEARRWLAEAPGPDFMVAGVIDIVPAEAAQIIGGLAGGAVDDEIVAVNFKIVRAKCPR
jgi:3-oxoacyl-[acyl-carrier-protein] synthase II